MLCSNVINSCHHDEVNTMVLSRDIDPFLTIIVEACLRLSWYLKQYPILALNAPITAFIHYACTITITADFLQY